MEKRDIRLIGLDLDGTTLTSDKVLTEHTKAVLEECMRKGVVVLPATGRVRTGIPDYLQKIEGIRYIITSNGASIVDLEKDEIVYENGIPWERALEVYDLLESYGTYYDSYIQGNGWCEARFFDHLADYNITGHIEDLVKITRSKIDDLRTYVRENKVPVEKISMFFASKEERDRVFKELQLLPDMAVTYSLENNIEINYHTCNKGDALLNLGKILNIPRESIMACGDGNNDLEMIRQAGVGVAMANGDEEVKANADFITKTNDEEGVAYAIKTICAIDFDR